MGTAIYMLTIHILQRTDAGHCRDRTEGPCNAERTGQCPPCHLHVYAKKSVGSEQEEITVLEVGMEMKGTTPNQGDIGKPFLSGRRRSEPQSGSNKKLFPSGCFQLYARGMGWVRWERSGGSPGMAQQQGRAQKQLAMNAVLFIPVGASWFKQGAL